MNTDWLEAEGQTKEEAESKLLEILNISDISMAEIEDVKVTRKFLGMGGKTIKLRGRVKEGMLAQPEAGNGAQGESAANAVAEAEDKAEEGPDKEPSPEPRQAALAREESPNKSEPTSDGKLYRPWKEEGPAGVHIPETGKGYRGMAYNANTLSGADQKTSGNYGEATTEQEDDFIQPDYTDIEGSPATEEDKTVAVEFLKGLIGEMGLEGKVDGYRLDDRLLVTIDSDFGGLLIGRKGETLDSLQYLADIVVNRKREGRVRISVDTEYYKERRKQKLVTVAKSAAEKASGTKRPVRLYPMSPAERQIVHAALADDSRVETISEGVGSRRKVVVFPEGTSKRSGKGDYNR